METEMMERIRQTVLSTLARLGMPEADGVLLRETVLLHDRYHVGRRFQWEGLRAVWFAGAEAIEFFDEDGNFLESVKLDQPPAGQRAAA